MSPARNIFDPSVWVVRYTDSRNTQQARTFRTEAALDAWLDQQGSDITVLAYSFPDELA